MLTKHCSDCQNIMRSQYKNGPIVFIWANILTEFLHDAAFLIVHMEKITNTTATHKFFNRKKENIIRFFLELKWKYTFILRKIEPHY